LTYHVYQVCNCFHHTHLNSFQIFILMSKYSNYLWNSFVFKFLSFLLNLMVHWINGMYRFNKGFRSFFLLLPPSFDG
jgi:hypothetical protein